MKLIKKIRKPLAKPTQVIKSKKKRKLEKIRKQEAENGIRDN